MKPRDLSERKRATILPLVNEIVSCETQMLLEGLGAGVFGRKGVSCSSPGLAELWGTGSFSRTLVSHVLIRRSYSPLWFYLCL